LVSIAIVFSACGGTSATPAKKVTIKEIPAWINAPLPNDSEKYMYGVAIESDRESAIKAALSDMIAKLGTTIESSFESNQEVRGSYSKSTVKNQIKSDISKIKINNYRVIKSHKVSYREFAVMIRTDKQKLVSGLKANLKAQLKSINQKYVSIRNRDTLTRYNTKKELSAKAGKLLSEILIISELDSSFNKQKNLDFISNKQESFLIAYNELKFYVRGDKKSLKFVEIVKNYLGKKGFNVTNSKKNAVQIKISNTHYLSGSAAMRIAVLTLKVSLFDKKQHIGGKSLLLKERYNGSYDSVYKNASMHFEQDIKSQGINEVLGINLNMD